MGVSKSLDALLRLSDRPIVITTFSFAFGISASLLCRHYMFGGLAVGGLLLIIAAYVAYRKSRVFQSFVLIQAAIFICGMILGLADRDGHKNDSLRVLLTKNLFPLNEPLLFEGRVVEEGTPDGNEIEITVDLIRYRHQGVWNPVEGKGTLRVATLERSERNTLMKKLTRRARLRSWAVWKKPLNFENPGSFDRAEFLARRNIFLTGRIKSPRLIESISTVFPGLPAAVATRVRKRVQDTLEPIRKRGKTCSYAILQSLLIGDRSSLDGNTREIFQNSGAFHILVVSGLHVAWITGTWIILLKAVRIPERLRILSAAVVILLYTWSVGDQAGITRCLWMFYLYLLSRLLVRRTGSANILFSAALILLATDPDRLYEAGYQLSFLSVAAISFTAAPVIEYGLKPVLWPLKNMGRPGRLYLNPGGLHRRGRTIRTKCELLSEEITDAFPRIKTGILCFLFRNAAAVLFAVGSMILLSLSVQLWIAPLLAFYFNRISWIAPLSNPVLVPIASATLASGILAIVLIDRVFFVPVLVRFAEVSSSFLFECSERIAQIPGAWQRCPTPSTIAVFLGILLLLLWPVFRWKRRLIPFFYNLVLLLFFACGSGYPSGVIAASIRKYFPVMNKEPGLSHSPALSLTMLDVGEGDCIVIRFPNRQTWVLDAGGLRRTSFENDSGNTFDTGEAVVSRFLWSEWEARPDHVILSHTDIDHAGGIPALLKNFRVDRLYYPYCVPDPMLLEILETARRRGTPAQTIFRDCTEKVGLVTVQTLHPPVHIQEPSINDNSVVLRLSFRRFSALLTGDLERKGEATLLSYSTDLASSLLKVAHHGSVSGTSSAFLDVVHPRWAVISSGRNNSFGHPSPIVLSRLSNIGAQTYQTANKGAITFTTDGIRYRIHSYIYGILEEGELDSTLER